MRTIHLWRVCESKKETG